LDSIDGLHNGILCSGNRARENKIVLIARCSKVGVFWSSYEGAFLIKPMAMLFPNVGKAGFGMGGTSGNGRSMNAIP
jgi:hypothetical protein